MDIVVDPSEPSISVQYQELSSHLLVNADDFERDTLNCAICLRFIRPGFACGGTVCRHVFCVGCMEQHAASSINTQCTEVLCPMCRADMIPDEVHSLVRRVSHAEEEEVTFYLNSSTFISFIRNEWVNHRRNSLLIMCPNVNCTHSGPFGDILSHLETCPAQKVYCIERQMDGKVSGCNAIMTKEEFKKHRLVCHSIESPCMWCGQSFTIQGLDEHMLVCAKRPIPCPNRFCAHHMPLANLRSHMMSCKYTEVECEFCYELMPQYQMSAHYQDSKCLTDRLLGCLVCRGMYLHDQEHKCPMRSVRCRMCKRDMFAYALETHKKVCVCARTKCKYCHKRMLRSVIKDHVRALHATIK